MKLIRFGEQGEEKPGVLNGSGKRKGVSHLFKDWDRACFQKYGLAEIMNKIKDISSLPGVPENIRWASCVAGPGKVVCIGLNYSDHATETRMPIPTEPIVFQKGTNTVVGPYDNILIPRKKHQNRLGSGVGYYNWKRCTLSQF